jgi:hypothetical protein
MLVLRAASDTSSVLFIDPALWFGYVDSPDLEKGALFVGLCGSPNGPGR